MKRRAISVRMIFTLLSVPLFLILQLPFPKALAQECGCYCGKWLPPPCSDDACKRACGWQEGDGIPTGGLNPGQQMQLELWKGFVQEIFRPEDPSVKRAREEEARRIKQETERAEKERRQAAERERRRMEQEKHDRLANDLKFEEEGGGELELKLGEEEPPARAIYVTPKPQTQSAQGNPFRAIIQCAFSPTGLAVNNSNQAVCNALTCGATDRIPVCCPRDYPLLNQCDCKCYKDTADFECARYTACQYTKTN